MAARIRAETPALMPAEPAEHRPVLAASDIDAQAMRRAVVMAEVLGKPRALARRR